jgi:DNA mismatch repair protein MSH4
VGENLARETCIASLDAGTPISLQVTKQGNGQTYAETMAYLEMLKPHEILLNEGRKNSPLGRKIVQLYESQNQTLPIDSSGTFEKDDQTVVKFISRSCFDQTKGAELLRKLARTDTFDSTLVEEYILLSSTHAVLHYTQQTLGASFSRKCLDVSVNSGGKNRMVIDRSTLLQLELLINAKTGKTRNSLVSSIDCTKTTVGTRLLRTTLMAPPCRSDTINTRLDLVDSFLEDEDFFYAVLEHLKNLPAVDKMLTDIAVVPKLELKKAQASGQSSAVTARLASKGIAALVCIKSTLGALPALVGVLQDHLIDIEADGRDDGATAFTGRSSLLVALGGGPPSTAPPQQNYLLRAVMQALSQPQLEEIRNHVSEVFTESTKFSRNANAMRHQECFALKSKDNGMMEILRKAFLANVDDIYKKADEYAEIHGMHVSVRYTSTRGYYLSVPADMAAGLPNIFIQPIKSGNHIYCTTEEVHSLNIRAQDNVQDLLLMTYERIQEVLADARSKYDALAALSDAIALLDLCHGFADKVTLSKLPWSRPVLVGGDDSNNGESSTSAILIRNGRYGIDVSDSYLSSSEGPREIIPNDTYASDKTHFTVISGINGSGKSTYLKQIAIIVLLAHCGSYVPAEQASIPVRSWFCSGADTSECDLLLTTL